MPGKEQPECCWAQLGSLAVHTHPTCSEGLRPIGWGASLPVCLCIPVLLPLVALDDALPSRRC